MAKRSVVLTTRGRIACLSLSRALVDGGVVRELRDFCDAIAADPQVRAAVLTADGKHFGAGWEWATLAGEGSPLDAAKAAGLLDDPFGCLAALPQPVVCAVHGDVLGAGLALALACDIRIAAEDARFGLPETAMGLLPLGGAVQRLSRLVGRGKAMELVLSAEPIDAQEALRIGLVSEVVAPEQLRSRADAIALRIAERGPLAVRYAKEAIARGLEMPLEQALRYETDLTIILQTTEDRAEGVSAFLEKRQPKFKGR